MVGTSSNRTIVGLRVLVTSGQRNLFPIDASKKHGSDEVGRMKLGKVPDNQKAISASN